MKKIIMAVLFSVFALVFAGCEPQKDDLMAEMRSERERSLREERNSREAEIEEVDEWGISLDDVDRLSKQAMRDHENVYDYKRDYNNAIRVTDDFLKDVESGNAVEYSLEYFLNKYKAACQAGIKYIEACVDVKTLYDLFMADDGLDRNEKDLLRTILTVDKKSIQAIIQSNSDMEALLTPIIEENRKLSNDELEKVYEVYQVLVDKAYR